MNLVPCYKEILSYNEVEKVHLKFSTTKKLISYRYCCIGEQNISESNYILK